MKVIMLYRPNSEHERQIMTYQQDFSRISSARTELVSIETKEGDNLVRVYGITDYPAIVVISDDGAVQNMWQGSNLPLMNEVAGYAFSS